MPCKHCDGNGWRYGPYEEAPRWGGLQCARTIPRPCAPCSGTGRHHDIGGG